MTKQLTKAINSSYPILGYPRKDVYFDCYGTWLLVSLKWVAQPSTLIQPGNKLNKLFASQMAIIRYFIPDTGNMAVNTFVQNKRKPAQYYLDRTGYFMTGKRINGKNTVLTQKAVKSKVNDATGNKLSFIYL